MNTQAQTQTKSQTLTELFQNGQVDEINESMPELIAKYGEAQIDKWINAQRRKMKWVAENLRDNRWVVRPEGQLGTCGWSPAPWTAMFVTAKSEAEALRRAKK
jgi:hypothetical protein